MSVVLGQRELLFQLLLAMLKRVVDLQLLGSLRPRLRRLEGCNICETVRHDQENWNAK